MMATRIILLGISFASVAAATCADEPLPAPFPKDMQVGHRVCETFVLGPLAGQKRSLICDLAGRPAALVYIREIDPAVEKLLAKLDAVAQQGRGHKMTSSFVYVTNKEDALETLRALAQRAKLEATIVTTHPANDLELYFGGNPRPHRLPKEAAVTVIIFQKLKIQSSHAIRTGELSDRKISEIVNALAALLPPIKI